jgi:hypothetical protein
MADLCWHRASCGAHETHEPTEPEYEIGGLDRCECGKAAHLMTLRDAARLEQARALGLPAGLTSTEQRAAVERIQARNDNDKRQKGGS